MDASAFGASRVMVFFTLKQGIDWTKIEKGFASFPYTKSILKTVTANLGYASFILPRYNVTYPVFRKSIQSLQGSIFDYLSIHLEKWTGMNSNHSLLKDQKWKFPFKSKIEFDQLTETHQQPKAKIICKGPLSELTKEDFVVASELVIDARIAPLNMQRNLSIKKWDLDIGTISRSIRKIRDLNIIKPYIYLGGVGLNTNMTVEILCTPNIIDKIVSIFCMAPSSMFFISSAGILLWLMVPSNQQVQYCQILEQLEEIKGIKRIWPIMTISHRGSRSILDLIHSWKFGKNGWWVPGEELDITPYILRNL
jgi:hypothetical protein